MFLLTVTKKYFVKPISIYICETVNFTEFLRKNIGSIICFCITEFFVKTTVILLDPLISRKFYEILAKLVTLFTRLNETFSENNDVKIAFSLAGKRKSNFMYYFVNRKIIERSRTSHILHFHEIFI